MVLTDRKQGMGVAVIGGIVLMLIVVALLFFILQDNASNLERASNCQGMGGVLAQNCSQDFVDRMDAFERTEDGLVCCRPKLSLTGSQREDFKAWKDRREEELQASSDDSTTQQSQSQHATLVNEGFNGNAFLYSDSEADSKKELKGTCKEPSDKCDNNPLVITEDVSYSFEGQMEHQFLESARRCEMKVYNAEIINEHYRKESDTADPVGGLNAYRIFGEDDKEKIKDSDWDLVFSFSDAIFNQGKYMLEMACYDDDGALVDDSKLLKLISVESQQTIEEFNEQRFKLEVDERIVSQDGQTICFATGQIKERTPSTKTYFPKQNVNATFFISDDKEGNCPQDSTIYESLNDLNDVTLNPMMQSSLSSITIPKLINFSQDDVEKACLFYNYTTSDDKLHQQRQTFSQDECDLLYITSQGVFNQLFEACDNACQDYDNQRSQCRDRQERSPQCMYALDCAFDNKELSFDNACADCEELTDCNSYNEKESCQANQCFQAVDCFWDWNLFGGSCSSCEDISSCSAYPTRSTCNDNVCLADRDCEWSDGSCDMVSSSGTQSSNDPETSCAEMRRGDCKDDGNCAWDYQGLFSNGFFVTGECLSCDNFDYCTDYSDKKLCENDG
ncbi:MAG: hypothetical protein ACQESC_01835, partial [Nanobdellota archaeon]